MHSFIQGSLHSTRLLEEAYLDKHIMRLYIKFCSNTNLNHILGGHYML